MKFDTFADLNLPEALQRALDKMDFIKPTPVQQQSIPPAIDGRDILGTAQTGTGKTGAFSIPLLTHLYFEPVKQALILAPTRELAAQIHQVLRTMSKQLDMRGVLVVGGESFNRQVDELDRGPDYIVATPGRLNDHLEQQTVDLSHIGFVVLDEVDRMLDMGFAPQVKAIMRTVPKKRQTLLFSATLPPEIQGMAAQFLHEPVRVAIETVFKPSASVTEQTIETTQDGKQALLLEEIEKRDGKILIFTRTQNRTDRLARILHDHGQKVAVLHGGLPQGKRKEALDRFRKGTYRILVATDLAGRGIDVSDIEHVINYDLPTNREDYIHRIGRTGRIGKTGQALNFVVPTDLDSKHILTGVKPKSRVVFSSSRGRRRTPSRRG